MSGLYIHIPFCRQKCHYCDFASFSGQENKIDAYLLALEKEASHYTGQSFDTLYIGGGTPSLLSVKQMEKLCNLIEKQIAPLGTFKESTLEANPESISEEKLNFLKSAGLNRLSLGLQSFDDKVLKKIGRIHTVADFLQAYENARKSGFDNINVDLIAGLPGQSEKDFLDGVCRLLALKPEHISIYGLQVEEGTPFYRQEVKADEDLLRQELETVHFLLQKEGFSHYEISNFAQAGYESRHNLNYWKNGEYVGLGSAAASYQKGNRFQNTDQVAEYIRRVEWNVSPVEFTERLTGKAKEGESLMLGLRMLNGISVSEEQKKLFGLEIAQLQKAGLVTLEKDLLKLTFEGIFLANQAFMSFVGPFDL